MQRQVKAGEPEDLEDHEWEEHHGSKDFVACRLCGLKCNAAINNHLKKRHGITSAAYRVQFPKSLQLPLSKKYSERDRSRQKGRALRALANIGRAAKQSTRERSYLPSENRRYGGPVGRSSQRPRRGSYLQHDFSSRG